MTGILLLSHGSREAKTIETMEKVAEYVKEELKTDLISCAYMEFREPNIEKGLNELINLGAEDIKIIPYFLFEGIHIKEDIPQELEEFKAKNPNVKITFGNTLGADKRLAMIVADRVREMM